jgi:hypothetical protein
VKVEIVRELPKATHNKRSKYEPLFDAAKRHPGKYVVVPRLIADATLKVRGLKRAQRNGTHYIFKPTGTSPKGAKQRKTTKRTRKASK